MREIPRYDLHIYMLARVNGSHLFHRLDSSKSQIYLKRNPINYFCSRRIFWDKYEVSLCVALKNCVSRLPFWDVWHIIFARNIL